MNKKRLITICLLMTSLLFISYGRAIGLDCPKAPMQVSKDWEAEVNATVAKIGPVKGGELKSKAKTATQDLIGKLPDNARIYLEQMMYSAYCSALRDDKKLKEYEKAKLLKDYNAEIRRTLTGVSDTKPKDEKKSVKKTQSNIGKSNPTEKKNESITKPKKPQNERTLTLYCTCKAAQTFCFNTKTECQSISQDSECIQKYSSITAFNITDETKWHKYLAGWVYDKTCIIEERRKQ